MQITKLNIDIIDTQTNERILIEEQTEINAPHLIYNGDEDLLSSIVSSELRFSILLNNAPDAELLHLYTGSETRYKVELNDVSFGSENLWTGFLLPEQYNEPYESGAIFINFIASDGIGRLKTQYLPDAFYSDKKPVYQVIEECLKLTGNSLDVYFAPAIINSVKTFNFDDLEVFTSAYLSDTKLSAYEILNFILESLVCRIFQFKGVWYVIGKNRLHEEISDFYNFKNNTIVSVSKDVVSPKYESSPVITILPKFKEVKIGFDPNFKDSVLPEDIIFQYPVNSINPGISDLTVDYWEAVGISSGDLVLDSGQTLLNGFIWGSNTFNPYKDPSPGADLFHVSIKGYASDFDSEYIQLKDPVYLSNQNYRNVNNQNTPFSSLVDLFSYNYITLNLKLEVYSEDYDFKTLLENGGFNDKLKYEILQNDVVILSNKIPTPYTGLYDFKLSGDKGKLTAELSVDRIILDNTKTGGYLQVKISPPLSFDVLDPDVFTRIDTLEINHNYDKYSYSKSRNIDFTTLLEKNLFHADEISDLSDKSFSVKGDVVINEDIVVDEVTTQITTTGYVETVLPPFFTFKKHVYFIDTYSYNLILENPDNVFLRKEFEATFINIPSTKYTLELDSTYGVASISTLEFISNPENSIFFEDGDTLWIKKNQQIINVTDNRYIRKTWKRYGVEEVKGYMDCVASIYHGMRSESRFVVNTNVFELVSPLEILVFKFLNNNRYIPSKIDMNLYEGTSQCTLIESKYEDEIDYGY